MHDLNTAFIFPGQASQKVGMGLDLFQNTEIGRKYYDEANDIMEVDIQNISFNDPEEQLTQTQYTQPAIYIVSVILAELLLEKGFKPAAAAGHSLGEYSALTIGKAFDFKTGLKLVKIRAENMQKAGKIQNGTMAAIIGISNDKILQICKQFNSGGVAVPANFNTPGQIVISGNVDAVEFVMEEAKRSGALKAIKLNVSGAFHSPLMSPVRESLAEILNSIEIQDTVIPIYSNVSANPVTKKNDILNRLIEQLEMPVLWCKTITNMIKHNIDNFVEVGPGRILQGLNRRIDRSVKISGIENLDQITQYV